MLRNYFGFVLVLVGVLFTACEQLPDAGSVKELPAMYNDYLDKRVEAVKAAIAETEGDYECFFWITDIHWEPDLNTRNAPAMIKYMAERTGIDKILNGGDTGNADVVVDNAISRLRDAIGSDRVYTVTGNHEITDASKYERPFRRVDSSLRGHCRDLVYGDGDRSYFYFDEPNAKMRYVGLSVFDVYKNGGCGSALNAEQLAWFKDVALNVSEGWTVVLFAHTMYVMDEATDKLRTAPSGADKFVQAIDTYQGKGEIACVLLGHTHRDRMHVGGSGVPYIVSACDRQATYHGDINVPRVVGTLTEQHFEVVVIDKRHKKVRLITVGGQARDGMDDEPGELTDERVISYEKR